MKLVPSSEQTQQSDDAVNQAEHLFNSVRSRLFALITEIEAGNSERAKSLTPLVGELRKNWHALRDERKRADEFGKKEADGAGHSAIDFASARREIERRLDSLRRSESSGGLSEQS